MIVLKPDRLTEIVRGRKDVLTEVRGRGLVLALPIPSHAVLAVSHVTLWGSDPSPESAEIHFIREAS